MADTLATYDGSASFTEFEADSLSWKLYEKPKFNDHASRYFGPSTSVLDIGCGSGRVISQLIAQGMSPGNVTGLDSNPTMVTQAHLATPGVSLVHADARAMPFGDGTFDHIIANRVMHELDEDDMQTTLGEISRVLKPGGIFFSVDAVPDPRHLGRWTNQIMPWGAEAKMYHHDFRTDIFNTKVGHGFDTAVCLEMEARTLDSGITVPGHFLLKLYKAR